jgi:hypothetical protein
MLKKSASFVLASLRDSTYDTKYDSPLRSLRPCLGQGASRRARVGRVRSLVFLSILRDIHLLSMTCGPLDFLHAAIVFRNL